MSHALHYLYLCSGGVTALRFAGHAMTGSMSFSSDFLADEQAESRHPEFSAWLASHLGDTFVLIVDVVEEEFAIEKIPGLRRFDEMAVVRRRLAQRFRDARLSQWTRVSAARQKLFTVKKEKAGHSRVLMSAITREQSLSTWLGIIEKERVPVRSVFSPALLAQRLLHHRLKSSDGLVVSEAPGGLRQTLIIDGEIRFSRLANNLKVIDLAVLQSECLRTIQYLLMSQQVSRDTLRDKAFPVLVLEGGILGIENIPDRLSVDNAVELPLRRVQLGTHMTSETVMLGALPSWCEVERGARIVGMHARGYADDGLRHAFTVRRADRWLTRGGIAAMACSVLAITAAFALSWLWPADSLELRVQADKTNFRQHSLRQELATYAVAGPEMRRVVEAAQSLRKRHVEPVGLMQVVSDGLGQGDELSLESMRWKRVDPGQMADWKTLDLADKGPGNSGGGGGQSGGLSKNSPLGDPKLPLGGVNPGATFGQTPLGAGTPLTASAPMGGPGPVPGISSQGPVIIELRGTLSGQSPMQQANDRVTDMLRRLKARCSCEVEVTQMPFDPASENGFNKSFEKSEDRDKKPPGFTLRLLFKEMPDPSTLVQRPDGAQDISASSRKPS